MLLSGELTDFILYLFLVQITCWQNLWLRHLLVRFLFSALRSTCIKRLLAFGMHCGEGSERVTDA
jgi:uncharacterized PurR-regulated membrane protein YhhQ (DUF165 family)